MSFRVWFRRWIRSIYRLLMASGRSRKSDKQRKKERERRLKAKRAHYDPFKTKRKYKRRRSTNARFFDALGGFIAASLGVLLLPFGLFHWGYKSAKRTHRKRTATGRRKSLRKTSQTRAKSMTVSAKQKKVKKNPNSKKKKVKSVAVPTKAVEKPSTTYTPPTPLFERRTVVAPPHPTEPKEPDENTPKSIPKNVEDQYIRKRMIIAGSSYCDKATLAQLQVGTRFEVSREPDNPHDKDAVKLTYNGEKIGYIPKQDCTAFVVALKLKNNIYGVITAIKNDEYPTKYEFETWIENE